MGQVSQTLVLLDEHTSGESVCVCVLWMGS
jgi:hypothetical protein